MSKILITGGLGYIGRHLLLRLKELSVPSDDILVVDNATNCLGGNHTWDKTARTKFEDSFWCTICDVADPRLQITVKEFRPNIVVHLASKKEVGESIKKPVLYYEDGIGSLTNLLQICNTVGSVKKFIFASSAAVKNKHERSPYGSMKKMCERIIKDNANSLFSGNIYNSIILRIFNPFGCSHFLGSQKDNSLFSNIVKAVSTNTSICLDNGGEEERDFIFIEDVISAIINSMTLPHNKYERSITIDVGCGRSTKVKDFVQLFEEAFGETVYKSIEKSNTIKDCFSYHSSMANPEKLEMMLRVFPKSLEESMRFAVDNFHKFRLKGE